MPIYAYRCESCGHAQDVLQKISDPVLTQCPACGAASFKKQVTAAGFQLKGTGWYVTDFRGGNNNTGTTAPAAPAEASGKDAPSPAAPASSGTSEGGSSAAGSSSSTPSSSSSSSGGAAPASGTS